MYKPKNKERNESSNIVQKIQQMAFFGFFKRRKAILELF